jgi:predicted nucleic acid-binding protein
MSRLAFFDTNVILYADDRSAPAKHKRAASLFADHLASRSAVVSLQVIQEYFSAATRKLGLSPEYAQRKVELLARSRVVRFEPADVVASIELHRLLPLSFWDALIVHAAQLAGASVLYSEDLQPGSKLAGVSVVNPFV